VKKQAQEVRVEGENVKEGKNEKESVIGGEREIYAAGGYS
jgi:hypothetical protein